MDQFLNSSINFKTKLQNSKQYSYLNKNQSASDNKTIVKVVNSNNNNNNSNNNTIITSKFNCNYYIIIQKRSIVTRTKQYSNKLINIINNNFQIIIRAVKRDQSHCIILKISILLIVNSNRKLFKKQVELKKYLRKNN